MEKLEEHLMPFYDIYFNYFYFDLVCFVFLAN